MALSTPAPAAESPCHPLELPGEIRNRIYHFALTPNTVHLAPSSDMNDKPMDWTTKHRSALGLTQACRLIRTEYQPLHRAQVLHSVHLSDLNDYMSTWIPPSGDTRGVLRVDRDTPPWTFFDKPISLLPLLHLRLRAPSLHAEVYREGSLPHDGVNAILYPRDEPRWNNFVEKYVVDLTLRDFQDSDDLSLEMRPMARVRGDTRTDSRVAWDYLNDVIQSDMDEDLERMRMAGIATRSCRSDWFCRAWYEDLL